MDRLPPATSTALNKDLHGGQRPEIDSPPKSLLRRGPPSSRNKCGGEEEVVALARGFPGNGGPERAEFEDSVEELSRERLDRAHRGWEERRGRRSDVLCGAFVSPAVGSAL